MGLTEKWEEDRQTEQHEYKLGGSDVSPGSPPVQIGLGKEEECSQVRSEVTLLTTGRKGMQKNIRMRCFHDCDKK